jgi:SAM-dependent methyltransferase
LAFFGLDPSKSIRSLKGLPVYFHDLKTLKRQAQATGDQFPLVSLYPCLGERFTDSGSAAGHYFHQDLLVARRVYQNHPSHHVDVGSRMDGLVAHVASFREIEVIDIRPQRNPIPNVTFRQADMMAPLHESLHECCDSLSSLHAIEHFGLGRYSDPVRYDGHLLELNNMYSLLRKGGKFYISVPIGPQRIEFNAHRVFAISYLLDCFTGKFKVDVFSYVDDNGDLHENVVLSESEVQRNFGCVFGCGIFELTKQ